MMLELLGLVFDLLGDWLIEFVLGGLFLGFQQVLNWIANKL
jgi:hypothetical protein